MELPTRKVKEIKNIAPHRRPVTVPPNEVIIPGAAFAAA
jgi:hypothetical protein